MEGEDLEDVPPLEDMSEAFSKCLKFHEQMKSNVPVPRNEVLEVSDNAEKLQSKRIEKLLGKEDADLLQKSKAVKKPEAKKPSNPNTYCGFKKGFLSAHPTKGNKDNKQKNNNNGEVPVVTKKTDEKKNVFPEVQEAINQQMPFLNSKEWVTEDLLTKIQSNPKLAQQFMDPRFSEAIQKFSSNPDEVMQECQTNPELREFIQQFCGLMGQHFTELGVKQDQKSKPTKKTKDVKSSTMYPGDEEKMKMILSDPEISAILVTPEIQELFVLLKKNPEGAQRMLRTAGGPLRQKIQKLVDAGLLQMAVV